MFNSWDIDDLAEGLAKTAIIVVVLAINHFIGFHEAVLVMLWMMLNNLNGIANKLHD